MAISDIGDFVKVDFTNGTTPPINATNLNALENRMQDIDDALSTVIIPKASGIVNMPGQSYMLAGRSNTQNILDSNDTVIIFDTEARDVRNEYDHTTGIFTATETGIYSVNTCVTLQPSADWGDGEYFDVSVRVYNGVTLILSRTYRHTVHAAAGAYNSAEMMLHIPVAATHTIRVVVTQASGATQVIHNDMDRTWLSIAKIA